jgi:hypothetical protein
VSWSKNTLYLSSRKHPRSSMPRPPSRNPRPLSFPKPRPLSPNPLPSVHPLPIHAAILAHSLSTLCPLPSAPQPLSILRQFSSKAWSHRHILGPGSCRLWVPDRHILGRLWVLVQSAHPGSALGPGSAHPGSALGPESWSSRHILVGSGSWSALGPSALGPGPIGTS